MRLKITHEIASFFEPPIGSAIRKLRMTPRTYDGQYVVDWRIDVDQDCRLDRVHDAYGNVIHNFSVVGPMREFTISATGEVEVDDTNGVLQTAERLPAGIFLRETPLTRADDAIRGFADDLATSAGPNPLDRCHALMKALNGAFVVGDDAVDDSSGTTNLTASEAWSVRKAGPIGIAHVFVAAARHLAIPARFVSGYVYRPEDDVELRSAAHSWTEAHIAGLGWVGFDVQADCCPTDAYVRVSSCLDQNGCAFYRGSNTGQSVSHLETRVTVKTARR